MAKIQLPGVPQVRQTAPAPMRDIGSAGAQGHAMLQAGAQVAQAFAQRAARQQAEEDELREAREKLAEEEYKSGKSSTLYDNKMRDRAMRDSFNAFVETADPGQIEAEWERLNAQRESEFEESISWMNAEDQDALRQNRASQRAYYDASARLARVERLREVEVGRAKNTLKMESWDDPSAQAEVESAKETIRRHYPAEADSILAEIENDQILLQVDQLIRRAETPSQIEMVAEQFEQARGKLTAGQEYNFENMLNSRIDSFQRARNQAQGDILRLQAKGEFLTQDEANDLIDRELFTREEIDNFAVAAKEAGSVLEQREQFDSFVREQWRGASGLKARLDSLVDDADKTNPSIRSKNIKEAEGLIAEASTNPYVRNYANSYFLQEISTATGRSDTSWWRDVYAGEDIAELPDEFREDARRKFRESVDRVSAILRDSGEEFRMRSFVDALEVGIVSKYQGKNAPSEDEINALINDIQHSAASEIVRSALGIGAAPEEEEATVNQYEDGIARVMAQNPGATREEVIAELKKQGRLPDGY